MSGGKIALYVFLGNKKFMKSCVDDAEKSYELICVSLCFLQVQTWPKA